MNRETPVICLTADAVIGAKERYLAEGFTDYLTKPVNSRDLQEMLVRYLPEGKVTVIQTPAAKGADAPAGAAEDAYACLRGAGIIPEIGLQYCQKNEQLYLSLLKEYVQNADGIAAELGGYYDARDWSSYSIRVHALKNSSRMIGAAVLADMAAKLETAADERRETDVIAEHGPMLGRYAATVEVIRAQLPALDTDAPEEGEILKYNLGDDDIMEFLPE